MRNTCVYTVLVGDYETLNEQPVAASSGLPFICLTDNPRLTSQSWQIVQVPTAFAMDPIRSQRLLKICPHRVDALSEFEQSLYIDNSVILRQPPEAFIEKTAWRSGFGLPLHSFRNSVHDEFIEVARLGMDDQNRVFEQLNHYLASGDAALEERPLWAAILLRDHRNQAVLQTMDLWMAHVLRYSRRDQLSINTALRQTGLNADRWELDNHTSWFHSWPHATGRTPYAGMRHPLSAAMPMPTQLQQARTDLQLARRELDKERTDIAAERQAAHTQNEALEKARQDIAHLTERLAAGEQACTDLARRHCDTEATMVSTLAAVHASTSWRLTAPLRRLKTWLN
ncbi:glycosyltransferase domain-containing protein [Hydrogenophaga sp. A37]|uniref:glycosyltransferase domain-containing protein n=1 Tax=Hydrogenophaga sp. A37 TaxID=1945864 RepID=UPI0009867FCA|nr:glycosyltransferase domain-containing protein [Hydrogenophaga sp. A37]OOG87176.1 hypothetical protein B0E41_04305 [Hydrogenophaga sp. A37]